MLGIIVQLLLSWLIVWWIERNDLRVLGLRPTRKRLRDFFTFLFITAACCASGFLLKTAFGGPGWRLDPTLSLRQVAEGLWWHLRSVLFEELIFRGVLLYLLMRKVGAMRAVLLSAIAFGIYHWFSFNVFGNGVQMLIVFLLTGLMGLVYAFGYARTYSLYVPIGIHFGWNFTQGFVFPEGPIGLGILQPTSTARFQTNSIIQAMLAFLFPVVSAMLVNFFLIRRKKQALPDGQRTSISGI